MFCVLYFHLYQQSFTFNCTAFPLVFHIVPTTNEAFIISWGELFYSLPISARVICCQPSCHNCIHLTIVFKSVAAKVLLLRCKRTLINRRRIASYNDNQCRLFSSGITNHAKLLSDRSESISSTPTDWCREGLRIIKLHRSFSCFLCAGNVPLDIMIVES